jgi:hypothetical protein
VEIRHSYLRALFASVLLLVAEAYAGDKIPVSKERASQWKQKQHVQFTENKGQMTDMDGKPVPFVLFKTEATGMDMYITQKGLTYVFLKTEKEYEETADRLGSSGAIGNEKTEKEDNMKTEWNRIDMTLKGASIKKENIITEGMSESFSHYFLAHCPDGITRVRSYQKITIREIYPGIDWVFYNSTEKGFKYDFIIHPGADPKQIQLIYSSLMPLQLDKQGNINIKTEIGTLTENAPVSYLNGKEIETEFIKTLNQKNDKGGYDTYIQFNVGSYTPSSSERAGEGLLIIDPALLWATFYGGNSYDGPMSIITDASGNVFVTGYTSSTNFPTQNGGAFFQGANIGSVIFILKFNNTGNLLWATYYGAGGVTANSIATDASGNVFITGQTFSTNFPTQNAGTFFQGTNGGSGDAFILKFDNSGNRLWATYYGGSGNDAGKSITTDALGNVCVTGQTQSTDLPTQNTGTFFQGANGGSFDAFILKFDNTGNRLWATYYGGALDDYGNSIATDAFSNVLVTGQTFSTDFPTQNAGTFFQGTNAGGPDAFILKFGNAGNCLWATYYGGSGWDWGYSIATDASGNLFVAGQTQSTNLPTQNAGTFYQGANAGSYDAFILKFSNMVNLLWGTYYGGSGLETIADSYHNLAIDGCGNVYMGFVTNSTNITVQASCDAGYFDNTFNGQYDQFIILFSNNGVLLWATYLGGNGNDFRSPLAVDTNDNLFVSGEWTGSAVNNATYPLTDPGGGAYYDGTFNGGTDDGFIVKFKKKSLVLTLATGVVNADCNACNGSSTLTPGGGCAPYTYLWSDTQTTQTAVGFCTGTYTVTVNDNFCNTQTTIVTVTGSSGLTTSIQTNNGCTTLGSATVTTSGGTGMLSYSWNPGGQTTASATGLVAGIYTVTVTDANGCSATNSVNIQASLSAQFIKGTANCTSCGCKEWIMITASGGTSPYSYLWSASGGMDKRYLNKLCPGTYTINVTDKNGCSINVLVNAP